VSGTGHCYDNARMESIFATLKKEKLFRIRTERNPMGGWPAIYPRKATQPDSV